MGPGTTMLMAPIKHHQDVVEYNRQKQMAGDLQKWSPWTGMGGGDYMPKKAPSLFNDMMQAGQAGTQQMMDLAKMSQGLPSGGGSSGSGFWGAMQNHGQAGAPTFYNTPNSQGYGMSDPNQTKWMAENNPY